MQHRIDEDDMGTAVKNARAVLTTLGERIQDDEAEDLAATLPEEIGRFLTEAESGQRFEFRESLGRVADRADVDEGEAKIPAQSLVALVGDIVPGGEMDDLDDGLPADYEALFEFVDTAPEAAPW